MELKNLKSHKTKAATLGHIDNVLEGKVPEGLADFWVKANAFKAAFEIGSPEGIESLGETIVLNGIAYTKSTPTLKLVYGEKFLTTGLFILPKDAKPSAIASGEEALLVSQLYEAIYQEIKAPFALLGVATFEKLEATAISKAPIYHEAIFEHKESYYTYPPLSKPNVHAALMGLVAPSPLDKSFTSVLYDNPFEVSSALNAHTHLLVVKNKLNSLSQIKPSVAEDVLHLFPQSTLASYFLEIYPLEGLIAFKELLS